LSVERPLILLTNDDGIDSPGLVAAAEGLYDLGELLIVAPATQQTGMGRSSPPVADEDGTVNEVLLHVLGYPVKAYALTGSPAQAVTYGILVIAGRRPDLVVSGINYGENLGTSVTVSGTVGAALEAAEYGVPGLAVSLETIKEYHYDLGTDVNWTAATYFTGVFAQALLPSPHEAGQGRNLPFDVDVLKVDVPADATPETAWRVTRQSRQAYYEVFRAADQPANGNLVRLDYDVRVDWPSVHPDSDIHAFAKDRLVAVTPLSRELTSRTDLVDLERLLRES
jgi:5'-nucleotidase